MCARPTANFTLDRNYRTTRSSLTYLLAYAMLASIFYTSRISMELASYV